MVATETALGSLLGLAVGDRPAQGLGWLAVVGFTVTVGSALMLARFGSPEQIERTDGEPAPGATSAGVGPG